MYKREHFYQIFGVVVRAQMSYGTGVREWSSPVWPCNFSHVVKFKIINDLGMYCKVELKIEAQLQYLLQCLHFVGDEPSLARLHVYTVFSARHNGR